MAMVLTFDPILSRVRTAALVPVGSTASVDVQRSLNGIYWTTVRGGSGIAAVPTDTVSLDDYEFIPNVVNHYRLKRYNVGGDEIGTDPSDTITPTQSGVWFKSIVRPFLNRAVEVLDYGDIVRSARNGIFEVRGRTDPIAVTDVRLSRRWMCTVMAHTVADADALELVFASGDPLFIQTDGTKDIPGGYVVVGEMARTRYGKLSTRRYFELPMQNVAAPGADVVGATSTWETLIAEFGTWADVLAAFGSWTDVLEYVADPSVVVVP